VKENLLKPVLFFSGMIPLDEYTQVRMIKLLLDHGADDSCSVENYQPADLLKPDRTHALGLLRRQNNGPRTQDQQRYCTITARNLSH
jgi:hypothetical protein